MKAVELTRVDRSGRLALPALIRRALNIHEGDYLQVHVTADSIVLTPQKLVDKSQGYFWSAEWQTAERAASGDIAAGRVREAKNADDLIASLDKDRKKKR